MTKRIAYVELKTSQQTSPVPEHLIAPGYAVDLVQTEIRVTPVDAADLLLSDVAYGEAAMRAARNGYDGVLIGALGVSGGTPEQDAALARTATA